MDGDHFIKNYGNVIIMNILFEMKYHIAELHPISGTIQKNGIMIYFLINRRGRPTCLPHSDFERTHSGFERTHSDFERTHSDFERTHSDFERTHSDFERTHSDFG